MKRRSILAKLLSVLFALAVFELAMAAEVLEVGPGKKFGTPCQAIRDSRNGDTIKISALEEYRGDVCVLSKDHLTLIGTDGRPKISAAGRLAEGKAIWVIAGNDTTVENIELTGAAGPDHNGAAIRQEGANLVVRRCYIHDNQEGILTGESLDSHILIEQSEFADNGFSDGLSHNLYIGHIAEFTLRFSYSHDARSGHLVKSRADQNLILYNRLTGEAGTSSYELDLPNGGRSYVIGNVIEQGPRSENGIIVAFGEEGATNRNSELYFVSNTAVNNRSNGTFIHVGDGVPPALVQNNVFSGSGLIIDQPKARMAGNLSQAALFVDPGNYDYHLQASSPARRFGTPPENGSAYSLRPIYQYVHPTCFERRAPSRTPDAGAFEFSVHLPTRSCDDRSVKPANN